MKKINLISRLLSNSHEKQSPQRFARYAAMLLLFLMCITHAWADALPGSFNGWNTSNNFTNGWNFVTISDAQDYTFKVYYASDDWRGAGTNDNDVTITRASNSTDLNGTKAKGGNIKFTADVVGTYLFILKDNNITVIYPATFTEETVLFFDMEKSGDGANWWNNSGCYHYATFTGVSPTSSATVHLYNVGDTDNSASDQTNSVYFATIPAGTYSYVSFYRGKSAATLSEYYDGGAATNVIIVNPKQNKFGTIYNANFGNWQGWSDHTQPTSTGSLSASKTNPAVGVGVTLTPSLTSNTEFNKIKSVAYTVNTGTSGTHWTIDGNTFTPLVAGSYTVTATITYNLKGWPSTTRTVSPTVTITGRNIKSLTVNKDGGISSVTGAVDDINTSTDYAITATPKTGYSFDGWTTDDGSVITITNPSSASTASVRFKSLNNAAVTATSTENMTTVNLIASPAGAGTFTSNASTVTSVSAGVDTKPSVTAVPGNGYYLNTSSTIWTKNNNNISLSATSAASTTITGCGTASTSSNLTATFTKKWYVKGDWNTWGETTPLTFTSATSAYVDIDLTINSNSSFKIWDKENNIYFTHNGGYNLNRSYPSPTPTYEGGSNNNMVIAADITGTYRVTVTFSSVTGKPTALTVTYPTVYTVTFGSDGHGTVTASATSAGGSFSSGAKVRSGDVVTFAQTPNGGYNLKGWYTTVDGSTSAGLNGSNQLTINGNKTVYAQFLENMSTITVSAGTGGTVTTGAGEHSLGVTTTQAINASVSNGYSWSTWITTGNAALGTTATTANNTATTDGTNGGSGTIVATFTPNNYYIILDVNGGSGANQTVNATFAAAMPTTVVGGDEIAARTRTGYNFDGYTKNNDGTGTKYYTAALASNANLDIYANNTHIYAKWNPKTCDITFDFDESDSGFGSKEGASTSTSATYDAAMTSVTPPTAAEGYAFMGFYDAEGGEGTKYYNEDGTSAATWDKDTESGTTLYAYYKKAEITALTLDNAVVAPSETVGVTPRVAPTPTGTNSICWKLLYSNGNLYSPQPTFSPASPAEISNKVTFTAPPTSGTYLIAAVLRTGNECNGGTKLDSVTSAFQVAGDHTVTVQYKCGDEVIRASASVTGKPLTPTEITAPDIVGYTFSKWKAGDGITIEGADGNGEKASATINFTAIYDGKLTAIYTKKQMIYFNNTLGWEDVWVYFYNDASGNKYWSNNYGTGANKQQSFNYNHPYWEQEHGQMTQIEGTDIWYFDFQSEDWYSTTRTKVAFVNKDQSIDKSGASNDEAFFHNASVIYREDFDATNLPMFVPIDAVEYDYTANTGSKYYRGYWMNYPESTGYTLKIYNKKEKANDSDKAPEEIRSIPFEFTADKTMPMELDVDLEAGKTYGFKIYCNNGDWLGNGGTMTATIDNLELSTGTSNCGLTTTAAGNYKFTLNYFAVSSTDYTLRIGVTYPVATGDYQVLYKDDTMSEWFISSVVPAASDKDTVSFFVRKDENPVLKLQKCGSVGEGTVTWSDTVDNLISVLPSAITQDSVYIFCLNKNAEGKRELGDVKAYTGNYYIRTDCAGTTKWDNYRAADHLMTYSEYSEKNSDFTHYFVAHVNSGVNVKYVIANDYSPNISDTLAQQDGDVSTTPAYTHVNTNGFLQANANVRFMWNRHNNNVVRAYLADAQTDGLEFLVLRANSNTDMTDADGNALLQASAFGQAGYNHGAPNNSIQFTDNENWIYEASIKIKPGAFVKLYAKFDDGYFYFKGVDNNTFDANNAIQLMEGTGDLQKVRVVFDFKTDRLLAAWVPEDATIETEHKINADVMFVREGQGDVAQLTFGSSGKISAIKSAYGVMRFNKWTLNNKDKDTHTVLSSPASIYERSLFWISFPFKVKLNDVFGFGTYGTHWAIQKYNGARRATEGFWAESSGFWEWMDRNTEYLEPDQGYLLAIDLDLLGEDNTAIWGPDSRSEQIELYFPSYGTMPDITSAAVEHTLPSHACTIDWSGRSNGNGGTLGSAYNRTIIDSHWNVMSVPTYVNTENIAFTDNDDWITETDGKHGPNFLYTWNMDDNTLTPTAGAGYHYHAMHAYMVQYHGKVTWTASSGSPYPIVARRTYAEQPKKVNFCLEIQQNEKMLDRTFVQLSDDEEVSAEFSFGEDMGKEFNSRKANIYTVIEGYLPAAGNTLPMSDQTTLVPVGVKTTAAGEYTFAMPEGTKGVSVVLIDNIAGTRTNLSLSDYTVALGKGDLSDRFMLEIAPIKQMPTDIENIQGGDVQGAKARKVMVDGILYIVKDGKVFDARGAKVK